MIGGLSPITLNGIVANTLAIQNGVDNYMPIWGAYSFPFCHGTDCLCGVQRLESPQYRAGQGFYTL